MDVLVIEVHDSHDLYDLIGDLDLLVHIYCTSDSSDYYDTKLQTTLDNLTNIFTRYTPRTDELVHFIGEFRELILSDKREMDVNSMLFLYDCFSHDLTHFVEYASTIGMTKENEHIIYKPTYMGIEQLLIQFTHTDDDTFEDDIFF